MVDNIEKANIFAGGFKAADEPDDQLNLSLTPAQWKVRAAIDHFIERGGLDHRYS